MTENQLMSLSETEAENVVANLSDFALFLTVMKHKEAYQNTLSIILDEPDILIREVKVEQVILNKSGKRAIRLDAWAVSEDERQFDMEMQNDSDRDSLPKRSRYYQGLLDSPILKSGKKTRYKQLPSTTIIFITQDDIFGKDRAKYTFTEQCEEVVGLKLEDGTKKIFLNMTSKNGSQSLINLLQYMKRTDINNLESSEPDKRIVNLDRIVTEVKQSEEWEGVKMDILDVGINRGMEIGITKGIDRGEYKKLILQVGRKKTKGVSVAEIVDFTEEDPALIQQIYDALDQYDAIKEWDKILEIVHPT